MAARIDGLAADADGGDDWQLEADLYLCAAGVNGETAIGSEIDLSFTDLINNLYMALMGGSRRISERSPIKDLGRYI